MKKILITSFMMFILFSAFTVRAAAPFVGGDINDFKKFGVGMGLGFGGFLGGPEEVNDWMSEKYSNYLIEEGTTDILMNWNLSLCMMYRPVKFFSMNYLFEMTVAPKFIGSSDRGGPEAAGYNLGRYSIIAEGLFNIPFGSGGSRFLIGGGPSYHSIYFENAKDGTLGFRAIPIGLAFGDQGVEAQLLLGVDLLSKGISDVQPDGLTRHQMELDYNSIFLHMNIIF